VCRCEVVRKAAVINKGSGSAGGKEKRTPGGRGLCVPRPVWRGLWAARNTAGHSISKPGQCEEGPQALSLKGRSSCTQSRSSVPRLDPLLIVQLHQQQHMQIKYHMLCNADGYLTTPSEPKDKARFHTACAARWYLKAPFKWAPLGTKQLQET